MGGWASTMATPKLENHREISTIWSPEIMVRWFQPSMGIESRGPLKVQQVELFTNGQHTKNDGKTQCLIGKSAINSHVQ